MQLLLLLITTVYIANGEPCKRLVCDYNSESEFRAAEKARFYPEDVDPSLCTHLVYRHTYYRDGRIIPGPRDISTNTTVGNYEKIVNLKKQNSGLKVLLLFDSYLCNTDPFMSMATNESSRNKLIADVIQLLRKHKFDGLEFQCIYFDNTELNPRSKDALSGVIAALRKAFDEEQTKTNSDRLLLSLSAYGSKIMDADCYDVANLTQNVDWVNMAPFGLREKWHRTAGHHSPLAPDVNNKGYSVATAISHWTLWGAPHDKLVMGVAAFGRSFTLTSQQTANISAPVTAGVRRPHTDYPGVLSYFEICQLIRSKGTLLYYDDALKVPYLVAGNQWVGYDDVKSLIIKVSFMKEQRLGGVSFFRLGDDDFDGHFCGQDSYPLLKAVASECSIIHKAHMKK